MAIRSGVASPVLALAASLPAVGAQGPVIDPARFTPYGGTGCGVTLDGEDVIARNRHVLTFDVTGARPHAAVALFVGITKADTPFAGTTCRLLTDMLVSVPATASANGAAAIGITAPGTLVGELYAQALTLDVANLTLDGSHGLEVLFPGTSPTVDPTTDRRHPCYYIRDFVWDYPGDGVAPVRGRIRWPSDTCSAADGPPPGRPIVIFLHGNAMTHTDHDYLMAHLARNGFVTCSISNGDHMGGNNEGRAREAISFLNSMHRFWNFASRLSNQVVFAGHSRGGEGAVTAARLLWQTPSLAFEPYTVSAVVSIAATDGGGVTSDPHEHLDGHMARAFLAIYGSRDPDVSGTRLEDPLTAAEETVVAIYDRAGSETSSEGFLELHHLKKALIYVQGATHRGFLDGCHVATEGGTIGCAAHREIAMGYVHAFLRWHVLGETAYRAYFDDTAVPTSVRIRDLALQNQLADLPRRVVDNFEQDGLGTSTIGDTVTWSNGIAQIAEGELWQLDRSAPHDTRGVRIKWGGGGTPWVRWGIPNEAIHNVGPARDVSRYDYLSFRVAQNYGDAWNPVGEDQDFHVRLFTGSGWSDLVRVGDHDRIRYPDTYLFGSFGKPPGDYSKTVLDTVRLPLAAFGGIDRTDVRAIYFYFTVPGHAAGSIAVDSLMFVD